jgi:hypothetical protein
MTKRRRTDTAEHDPGRPFTTRETAMSTLLDIIRRRGDIDLHHHRILCELAEFPARTRAAIACSLYGMN